MRWILVFLFLYFIPLIVLFKNYNNKKRSFLYGSTYVILVTTIVTTNMYISGLNKIKEAMYYENYSFENEYTMDDFDNQNKDILYEAKSKEHIEEDKWHLAHHLLLFFGRYHCFARNPKCNDCPLKNKCNYI